MGKNYESDDRVKFLHIMPQGSTVYDYSIIKMFNSVGRFDSNQHKFIVSSKELYDKCKSYVNVIYDSNLIENFAEKKIWLHQGDIIFLHSNTLSLKQVMKLTKQEKNRIVWCTWGHDLYRKNDLKYARKNSLKRFIKAFYFEIYDRCLTGLKGIGIGFDYDRAEVKTRFKTEMKIYKTPYFNNELSMDYFNKVEESLVKEEADVKIMIGHSAYPFLNHKKILDMLLKYREKNIKISLVLSYGLADYAHEISIYAKKIYGDKIEIVEKPMSIKAYIDYLKSVDIAIFDHSHQSALSNIFYLIFLGKKLFLNSSGIIAKALSKEKITYFDVEDINTMNYEDFVYFKKNIEEKKFVEKYIDPNVSVNIWEKTLAQLNKD